MRRGPARYTSHAALPPRFVLRAAPATTAYACRLAAAIAHSSRINHLHCCCVTRAAFFTRAYAARHLTPVRPFGTRTGIPG